MENKVIVKELGKFIPGTQNMTIFELKKLKTNDLIYTFSTVRNYLKDFSTESIAYRDSFNAYITLTEELVNRKITKVLTNDSYIIDIETF